MPRGYWPRALLVWSVLALVVFGPIALYLSNQGGS